MIRSLAFLEQFYAAQFKLHGSCIIFITVLTNPYHCECRKCPLLVRIQARIHLHHRSLIHLKNLTLVSRLSGLLNVIGIDTHRSATYDFLLTFHSNYRPILYHFQDKQRLQSKIAIFPHPMYLTPPLKRFPLEFVTGTRSQKLE